MHFFSCFVWRIQTCAFCRKLLVLYTVFQHLSSDKNTVTELSLLQNVKTFSSLVSPLTFIILVDKPLTLPFCWSHFLSSCLQGLIMSSYFTRFNLTSELRHTSNLLCKGLEPFLISLCFAWKIEHLCNKLQQHTLIWIEIEVENPVLKVKIKFAQLNLETQYLVWSLIYSWTLPELSEAKFSVYLAMVHNILPLFFCSPLCWSHTLFLKFRSRLWGKECLCCIMIFFFKTLLTKSFQTRSEIPSLPSVYFLFYERT